MRTIADCIHGLTKCYKVGTPGDMHHAINEHVVRDTIAHLKETERLRAALQLFIDMPEECTEDEFLPGLARMRAAFKNAREILQPLT